MAQRAVQKSLNWSLWEAAAQAQPDAVRAALRDGADPKAFNVLGRTALIEAARSGSVEALNELLPFSDIHAKDNQGLDAFMSAAEAGRLGALEALAPLSARGRLSHRTQQTPLMLASAHGHADCCAFLLDWNNPRDKDAEGRYAMSLAVISQCIEPLRLLAPLCDPLAGDYAQRTALMFSTSAEEEFMRILLPISDPHQVDDQGRSAWHYAMRAGSQSIVAMLLPALDPAIISRQPPITPLLQDAAPEFRDFCLAAQERMLLAAGIAPSATLRPGPRI